MARKILVLESSNPRIKKVVALLLVRRGLADWVTQNVSIRMRPLSQFSEGSPAPRPTPNYAHVFGGSLAPIEPDGHIFREARPLERLKILWRRDMLRAAQDVANGIPGQVAISVVMIGGVYGE